MKCRCCGVGLLFVKVGRSPVRALHITDTMSEGATVVTNLTAASTERKARVRLEEVCRESTERK